MIIPSSSSSMSRRTALAGLGAGAIGVSFAAAHHATAQDATPGAMAAHPIIGTWIIDRDITTATEAPSIVVVTADGGVIDPSQGVAGAWQVTGERTVLWTLVGTLPENGGTIIVRSTPEVDETGMNLTGTYTVTIVAPDGSVMATIPGDSTGVRLPIEPMEAGGAPLQGIPTWTPAPPADATPTS
jgi:hypothetical protein